MPFYNVEKYLTESIDSILEQSFSSFELILVNDGSTDNSRSIAESYQRNDDRIIIVDKPNGGASSARNLGISISNGMYIYFIDSDDIILSNTLEFAKTIIDREALDVLAFCAEPFYDKDYEIDEDYLCKVRKYYERNYIKSGIYQSDVFSNIMSQHDVFVASVCLFFTKADIVKKTRLEFKEGIMHEDELFTRKLFSLRLNLFFSREKIYLRRIRKASVSTNPISVYKAVSYLKIAEELEMLKNRSDFSKEMPDDAKSFYDLSISVLEGIFDRDKEYKSAVMQIYKSTLYRIFPDYKIRVLKLRYPLLRKTVSVINWIQNPFSSIK
jgi:glycosyltransferase involved in cell wall biosynthesis